MGPGWQCRSVIGSGGWEDHTLPPRRESGPSNVRHTADGFLELVAASETMFGGDGFTAIPTSTLIPASFSENFSWPQTPGNIPCPLATFRRFRGSWPPKKRGENPSGEEVRRNLCHEPQSVPRPLFPMPPSPGPAANPSHALPPGASLRRVPRIPRIPCPPPRPSLSPVLVLSSWGHNRASPGLRSTVLAWEPRH